MTSGALRLAATESPAPRLDLERLWTPQDLSAFLQCKSERTFRRVKKSFPRVPGICIERYDPRVVRAVIAGDTPAKRHRVVRATARRLG